MSGEHSPGPWRYCGQSDDRPCVCGLIWSQTMDAPIAKALARNEEEMVDYPPEIVAANMRLIAAAPELLDALQRLCDHPASEADWKHAEALLAELSPKVTP